VVSNAPRHLAVAVEEVVRFWWRAIGEMGESEMLAMMT
jgi:hypothetical protein